MQFKSDELLWTPSHGSAHCLTGDEEMRASFKVFDINGDGFIDSCELRQTLKSFGNQMTEEEVSKMLTSADSNNDGRIDYEGISQSSSTMNGRVGLISLSLIAEFIQILHSKWEGPFFVELSLHCSVSIANESIVYIVFIGDTAQMQFIKPANIFIESVAIGYLVIILRRCTLRLILYQFHTICKGQMGS